MKQVKPFKGSGKARLNHVVGALLWLLVLAFLLTSLSFLITAHGQNWTLFKSYFSSPLTFFSSFIIIFPFLLFFYGLTNSLRISFVINFILWLGISLLNEIKIAFRSETLKFNDFALYQEALKMVKSYHLLDQWPYLIGLLIFLVVLVLLTLFIRRISLGGLERGVAVLLAVALFFGSLPILNQYDYYTKLGTQSGLNLWNEIEAYQAKGSVYSFVYFMQYLKRANYEDYNKNEAKALYEAYPTTPLKPEQKVNIIGVMLESFKDFSEFSSEALVFTQDPYAYFHELEAKSLHGQLVPDIYGGGTINTEYQFLTGFREQPSFNTGRESNVRYFRNQGYYTAAFHPNEGNFYNRTATYKHMGFANFFNKENYFGRLEDWKSDKTFFTTLIDTFQKHQGEPVFLFGVTLQNHGPYEEDRLLTAPYIKKTAAFNEQDYNYFNNYLAGIHDTSERLRLLVDGIEASQEPTILVLFGDHSPKISPSLYQALGFDASENTVQGFLNKYRTPFLIYGNQACKTAFQKPFTGTLAAPYYNPLFLMPIMTDYLGISGRGYNHFMQGMAQELPVFKEGLYYENGAFQSSLTPEGKALLHDFHNFETYDKKIKIAE